MQKTISNIRNLIFDLDETLILLPVDWSLVYRELGRLLGREVSSFTTTLSALWGSELYGEVSRLVEKYELESLNGLIVLDDSPRILRKLWENYELNLTSLQSRRSIESVLNLIGVRELFKVVVSRDEQPTRSGQIKLVLSIEGYKASETMMVGDRVNDVLSALENNCKAALLVRRASELENLRKLGLESETLILNSLMEFYSILNREKRIEFK
ncbi:HAD family hydrolase [Candidatus Bathyarchaeota archaeon]|nr:HAD family hydrolase [Candidatus Bathyarchaeota archaeon]MBS7612796.1 HAD family hydrolase [Candidatus Bathyarchaeota archaeon]MBS7618839.1 HAD family hydrolase [Candidatus Bathyarchaeota archaeon]